MEPPRAHEDKEGFVGRGTLITLRHILHSVFFKNLSASLQLQCMLPAGRHFVVVFVHSQC